MRFFLLLISFLCCCNFSYLIGQVQLVCPNDITVSCLPTGSNLSQYGDAYLEQFGNTVTVNETNIFQDRDECGAGFVKRYWEVVDMNGVVHTCLQKIHIEGFTNQLNIRWPYDYHVVDCDPHYAPNQLPSYYDEPTILGDPCSNLSTSYQDHTIWADGRCTEIKRDWQVVDLCYSNNPNPGHFNGVYYHTQTIRLTIEEEPSITFPSSLRVTATECEEGMVDVVDVSVNYSTCGGEYIVYHDSPYSDIQGVSAAGMYPVGTTYVNYTVEYGCFGQSKSKRVTITVDEADPIELRLKDTLKVIEPQSARNIMIEASAFDEGSYSPCGESLSFSFSEDDDKETVYQWERRMPRIFDMTIHLKDNIGNHLSKNVTVAVVSDRVLQDKTRAVSLRETTKDYVVYFQPALGNLRINSNLSTNDKVQLSIFSINGEKLYTESINVSSGKNNHSINMQAYADGMYIAILGSDEKIILTQKIVKY